MRHFIDLLEKLESRSDSDAKIEGLVKYFREASEDDKLWAIALFSGNRPKRTVTQKLLYECALEVTDLPLWLFEESFQIIDNSAEAIALLIPEPESENNQPLNFWIRKLIELTNKTDDQKKSIVVNAWKELDKNGRYVFNKLLVGGFRISLSPKLLAKGLSKESGIPVQPLIYKLVGDWDPMTSSFESFMHSQDDFAEVSKHYPFHPIPVLEDLKKEVGEIDNWQIEHEWDGIRVQIIIRNGVLNIWSDEEELLTHSFPELLPLINYFSNGTVIDAKIICHNGNHPIPSTSLLNRKTQKKISKTILEKAPVWVIAHDLLEHHGKDIRHISLSQRRNHLESICSLPGLDFLHISELLQVKSWTHLSQILNDCRAIHSVGFLLKRKASPYNFGINDMDWVLWKVDPFSINTVLLYVQQERFITKEGFTNFTLAIWDRDVLIPITKVHADLTKTELLEINAFVKKNTLERFGPVKSVKPELVFEISFESIQESKRHKSGISLKAPKVLKWLKNTSIDQANTLADVQALLEMND